MPRSRSSRRLVVVGDDGKRAAALDAAIARADQPPPYRIAWLTALESPGLVAEAGRAGDLLRVESPGSSLQTWSAIAARGGIALERAHAEWRPGRAWFRGLTSVLAEIEQAGAHLVPTHPARHVLTMTDKAACHARLRDAGVPVPEAITAPASARELDDALTARGLAAVFVKPRWGSSGAGVLAYRRSGARRQLVTTAVVEQGRIWNDKRLRTYRDPVVVARLLDVVLGDGAVVERWIPKATLAGGPFDLRVLVVDGHIAQRVARVGRGTITNLHLKSARLDADLALGRWGTRCKAAVYDACSRAAACFPGHVTVAVDVMIDARGRPYVLECNAWGDYLPGLLDAGLDSYDVHLRALEKRAA